MTHAEEHIKYCAKLCNVYKKKNHLSRVINSSSWEDEFKKCIENFTTQKHNFETHLLLYIGQAVNNSRTQLMEINEKYVVCVQLTSLLTISLSRVG